MKIEATCSMILPMESFILLFAFIFEMSITLLLCSYFYGSVSFNRFDQMKAGTRKGGMDIWTTSNDEKQTWKCLRLFLCLLHFGEQHVRVYVYCRCEIVLRLYICLCTYVWAHIPSIFALEKFKWISNGVLTSSLSLYERKADLLLLFSTFVYFLCANVCCFGNSDCYVTTTTTQYRKLQAGSFFPTVAMFCTLCISIGHDALC